MNTKIDCRAMIQPLLDAEVERWSKKSWEELVSELKEEQNYTVEFNSRHYQVEVQLLENTANYIHVMVAVDDGHITTAIHPPSDTFILQKDQHSCAGPTRP